jgi:hypothetical protein
MRDLADRLKVSPEAARALAKRLRLPRSRGNDGKALVSVDLAEINHTPLPARSPAGHQAVTSLKAKIETLQAELAKLEAVAGGHRADFEWERDQGQKLKAEFLKMIAVTMSAKEATARLEGELAALKARPWWRPLPLVSHYGSASSHRKGVKPFAFAFVSRRSHGTPRSHQDSTRQTQAVSERAA